MPGLLYKTFGALAVLACAALAARLAARRSFAAAFVGWNPLLAVHFGGTADEVMKHMARLWGFTVRLETQHEDGGVELVQETRIEKRRGHSD